MCHQFGRHVIYQRPSQLSSVANQAVIERALFFKPLLFSAWSSFLKPCHDNEHAVNGFCNRVWNDQVFFRIQTVKKKALCELKPRLHTNAILALVADALNEDVT